MKRTNLVANELHAAGFRTKATLSNAVEVSLTSRKVSRMEVETALDRVFEGIAFTCTSTAAGVVVTW